MQYYVELHKQENLWKSVFRLLSSENQEKFKQTLKQMNVTPYETKIVPINTCMHLYHATFNGKKPYIIVGYRNYTVYKYVDIKNDEILETTGYTPNFFKAYDDVDYRDYMVVTFNTERNS